MTNYFKINVFFLSLFIGLTMVNVSLYSQFSISGRVYYSDNNASVSSGLVYIIKYNQSLGISTILGLTSLNQNGTYNLLTYVSDSILVCTGWLPEVEEEDHVLTYYPSTINWLNAQKVYPPANPVNIDISVQRMQPQLANVCITGTVTSLDQNSNPVPLAGATVIAIKDSFFTSVAITDSLGNYTLDSLTGGTCTILSEKIGYNQDSVTAFLGGDLLYSAHISLGMEKTLPQRTNVKGSLPGNFFLNQNYPNPFNPQTKIKFTIPGSGDIENYVKLSIYNTSGKQVKTLIGQLLAPGAYEITWDASGYPSGVYFYELKWRDYKMTRKMILLK